MERIPIKTYGFHVAARLIHRLLDSDRDFSGLAESIAHSAVAITDNSKGRESEYPTSLYHLGNTSDCNQFLLEAIGWTALYVLISHFLS